MTANNTYVVMALFLHRARRCSDDVGPHWGEGHPHPANSSRVSIWARKRLIPGSVYQFRRALVPLRWGLSQELTEHLTDLLKRRVLRQAIASIAPVRLGECQHALIELRRIIDVRCKH